MLLASYLWIEYNHALDPSFDLQIIYSSRTHRQLDQIAHEVSKTAYQPRLIVMGSREQLCINESVISHAKNNEKSTSYSCKIACQNDEKGREKRLFRELLRRVNNTFKSLMHFVRFDAKLQGLYESVIEHSESVLDQKPTLEECVQTGY